MLGSTNEWGLLKKAVIGSADGFRGFHLEKSFLLFYWENIRKYAHDRRARAIPIEGDVDIVAPEEQILAELSEDINLLVGTLQGCGVEVFRPRPVTGRHEIVTPYWRSVQSPALNVRDQAILFGDTIIETAPHVRARLFENDHMKEIFYSSFAAGYNWISMPRPTLSRGSIDSSYFDLSREDCELLEDRDAVAIESLGDEIVFDGAQCVRLGRDVLVNVANRSHQLGFEWLSRTFAGKFNFLKLDRIADSHIDSLLLPLRQGLWLIRDRQLLHRLPKPYSDWDFIEAPVPKADLFPDYHGSRIPLASKFIDMNVLSLDSKRVVVNELYPELAEVLESAGFSVILVRHRHRRLFGGGFHCFSLDLQRELN